MDGNNEYIATGAPPPLPQGPSLFSFYLRGAKRKLFFCDLARLLRKHSPEVIFIMEARLQSDCSQLLSSKWPSFSFLCEPSFGRSGGWIFGFNHNLVSFSPTGKNSRMIWGVLHHCEDHISSPFVVAYGEPEKENKLAFILSLIHALQSGPCLIFGDLKSHSFPYWEVWWLIGSLLSAAHFHSLETTTPYGPRLSWSAIHLVEQTGRKEIYYCKAWPKTGSIFFRVLLWFTWPLILTITFLS